jgi:uncharacterized protein (TIGR00725 family)
MVKEKINRKLTVSVIGESLASPKNYEIGYQVGKLLAKNNAVVVCGGLRGVMEAVAKGAKEAGGLTVGIVPSTNREDANPYIDIPIVTGMGYARNVLVVRSGLAIIAIGGRYGTLSEIGHALDAGIPIVGLNTWSFNNEHINEDYIIRAQTPEEAVDKAIKLAKERAVGV